MSLMNPLGDVPITDPQAMRTVWLTATELQPLAARIEELLAPFAHRAEPPAAARSVRVLRHYLPEAEW